MNDKAICPVGPEVNQTIRTVKSVGMLVADIFCRFTHSVTAVFHVSSVRGRKRIIELESHFLEIHLLAPKLGYRLCRAAQFFPGSASLHNAQEFYVFFASKARVKCDSRRPVAHEEL